MSCVTCQVSPVKCQVSSVRCRKSAVSCQLSVTPTATATDPTPANSPIMHSRLVAKTQPPKKFKTQQIIFRKKIYIQRCANNSDTPFDQKFPVRREQGFSAMVQSDTQTTDSRTLPLRDRIGPVGRFSENME